LIQFLGLAPPSIGRPVGWHGRPVALNWSNDPGGGAHSFCSAGDVCPGKAILMGFYGVLMGFYGDLKGY